MDGRKQDTRRDALLERDARLRLLMDAAVEGVLISQDGVITEVSESWLASSGYRMDEVLGRPLTDFIESEFRELLQRATEVEDRFEVVAVLKNGQRLELEALTRTCVIGGRTSQMTALRDVTERRRLEEQLRHTSRIEAIGRVASGVAHDFNSLLTVIRGYTEVLVRKLGEPHRTDALEVLRAAEAGAALTQHLLAYIRRDAPVLKTIDLNAVVHACEQMVRRLVGPRIALVTDLAPGASPVTADSGQLQQVILNLAANARDALPRGGTLTVRTRRVSLTEAQARELAAASPGDHIMLELTDSGTGMSADVRTRMFEPFFTTKERGEGTGLGLALVQAIVEQSHGFIVVDSTVDVGSTVAVYMPMAGS